MRILTVTTLLLVAVTMGLSLAHALEFPGKLRLDEAAYRSVQEIYYPGFTIGGLVGEAGGLLALAVLLGLTTPYGGNRFWWTLAALVLMASAHATYWIFTHPVNNFWVKDIAISGAGSKFFSAFVGEPTGDWKELRTIWEYSHVARAFLMMLSLACIAVAATLFERTPE